MSKRLHKILGSCAALLAVVLASSSIQALSGGSGIPTRLFVILAIMTGFMAQASVVIFATRKVMTAIALNESRRAAAYMKGVRDTLAETGLSIPSQRPRRDVISANGHLRGV